MFIPDYLKRYASLGKEAVLIGVLDRVEVWEPTRYRKLATKLQKSGEAIAERLSRQGV
jgi:MraZ protein